MNVAVYTYYDNPAVETFAGFSFKEDLQDFVTLSVREAKKHIGKTKLVATVFGAEVLKDCGFDEIDTSLEDVKFHKAMWAYAKIYTYSIQKEPFLHIDLDAIIWRPLTKEEKEADFVFQMIEPLSEFKRYKIVADKYKQYNTPVIDLSCDYGVCCGFFGANDLGTVKLYKEKVDEFMWKTDFMRTGFWHINNFFEQYFIACLTTTKNIKFVGERGGITHLWNKRKCDQKLMNKIRLKLNESPRTAP